MPEPTILPLYDVDNPQSFPPPPNKIIPGVVSQNVLTSIWGAPGSGKSHIALDLACMIAQKYPVVYVAAEAPYEVGIRAIAWKIYNNTSCFNNLRVWTDPIFIINEDKINSFIGSIAFLNPIAVFVDPLAQCFMGGNENETEDMGMAIYNLNRISRILNCAVIVVAHTGWNQAHERGNSSLRAANRISLSVKMNSEGIITLKDIKKNVGPLLSDRHFRIHQIGDKEEETVVVPTLKESILQGNELSDRQKEVLASLSMAIFSEGVVKPELAQYAKDTYGMSMSGAYKAVNVLIEKELAYILKSGKVGITLEGRELNSTLQGMENSKEKFSTKKFNWTLLDSPSFSSNSPLLSTYSPPILQGSSTPNSPTLHPSPPYKGEGGELNGESPMENKENDKEDIH